MMHLVVLKARLHFVITSFHSSNALCMALVTGISQA